MNVCFRNEDRKLHITVNLFPRLLCWMLAMMAVRTCRWMGGVPRVAFFSRPWRLSVNIRTLHRMIAVLNGFRYYWCDALWRRQTVADAATGASSRPWLQGGHFTRGRFWDSYKSGKFTGTIVVGRTYSWPLPYADSKVDCWLSEIWIHFKVTFDSLKFKRTDNTTKNEPKHVI